MYSIIEQSKINRKKSKRFGWECDMIEYINHEMNDEHLQTVWIPQTDYVVKRVPTWGISHDCYALYDVAGNYLGAYQYLDVLMQHIKQP